jgi:hypothetical protein
MSYPDGLMPIAAFNSCPWRGASAANIAAAISVPSVMIFAPCLVSLPQDSERAGGSHSAGPASPSVEGDYRGFDSHGISSHNGSSSYRGDAGGVS